MNTVKRQLNWLGFICFSCTFFILFREGYASNYGIFFLALMITNIYFFAVHSNEYVSKIKVAAVASALALVSELNGGIFHFLARLNGLHTAAVIMGLIYLTVLIGWLYLERNSEKNAV